MKLSRFAGIEGNVGVLRIECTRRQQFMIAVMNEINAVVDRYGAFSRPELPRIE